LANRIRFAEPVNVNTATEAELRALPLIGSARALRIIEYRETQGTIDDMDELAAIIGSDELTLTALANRIRFAEPVNVNTATQAELEALPYIGAARALRIIEYRETQGTIDDMDELAAIIGDDELTRNALTGRVTFGNE